MMQSMGSVVRSIVRWTFDQHCQLNDYRRKTDERPDYLDRLRKTAAEAETEIQARAYNTIRIAQSEKTSWLLHNVEQEVADAWRAIRASEARCKADDITVNINLDKP